MKVKTVTYEKKNNLGGYEHEVISLEIILEGADKVTAALDAARLITENINR